MIFLFQKFQTDKREMKLKTFPPKNDFPPEFVNDFPPEFVGLELFEKEKSFFPPEIFFLFKKVF